MKTQGEIESAISECMGHYEQEYTGRGPKDVRAFLMSDLVVVRLRGVLTATEQHLLKTLPTDKGKHLLKQVRTHLIDLARPTIVAMVENITGVKVVCLHHDICTMTDEEVVLLSLTEAPLCRELRSGAPAHGGAPHGGAPHGGAPHGEPSKNLHGHRRREVIA